MTVVRFLSVCIYNLIIYIYIKENNLLDGWESVQVTDSEKKKEKRMMMMN